MYTLYTFCRSSAAWRARLALELKNIRPEYRYVHLLKGQQKNESYAKLNPNQVFFILKLGCSFFGIERRNFADRIHGNY